MRRVGHVSGATDLSVKMTIEWKKWKRKY